YPFANYTNLESGDYVMRVAGRSHHGDWSEKALAVALDIAPPPWRTWWAYALYALTAVGLGLALYKFQQQKLAKLASDHQLAAVTKDLELTGAVQIGFLPREPAFQLGNVAVQGYYRPAGT